MFTEKSVLQKKVQMKRQSSPNLLFFDFKEIVIKNTSTSEPFIKISRILLGGTFDCL